MTRVPLDELIISDESGFACSKSKLVETGLPHLRPFNISDAGNLDLTDLYQVPLDEAPRGKSSLEEGDVLFNNTNSAELVGKSALIGSPMVAGFSNHMTRIKVDRTRIEPAFFAYWLRKLRSTGYFTAHATQWVSQAAYKSSELRKLDLDLPPLSEQRRIVDLLSRAEGIVRLRREAEKKAAELIPALFLDMFGDPAANPKGWLASTLGEVAVVQGGLQVTKARAELPLARPYLRVANVHRSRLELGEIKQIRLTQAELERTRLAAGDLLVVEGHGNADEIGRVSIWDGSINDCVHQNHLIRVRLNPDAIHPTYACEFLNSQSGRQFLLRSGKTTSGLNTISVSNVKAATILLPELSLQHEFATRVESVRSIQTQQSTATTKAQATFDALLARVFSES